MGDGAPSGSPGGPGSGRVAVLLAAVDGPADRWDEAPDPVAEAALARRLGRVQAEVERHGGAVARVDGGRATAVFGLPPGTDAPAERALRAALSIRSRLAERAAGHPGGVRIAIVTVVPAAGAGPGGEVDDEAVRTGIRIRDACPPGSVLVVDDVREATGAAVEYGPPSLLALPGDAAAGAAPVTVWSAIGPRGGAGAGRVAAEPVVPAGKEPAYDRMRFSPALRVGGALHVSGHVGRAPDGSISADPATQFEHAFSNVAHTLAAAGASWADVVEMTTYHVGLRDHLETFAAVRDRFVVEPYPAWTAVGVAELLAPGALVEIRAIAAVPEAHEAAAGNSPDPGGRAG
jgi:enamine deaminase RidA (YjgF/YER057c/UK114 family)